ncbi:MAG: hypothetical protein AAFV45_15635 [Pseudomonadota bacterium]
MTGLTRDDIDYLDGLLGDKWDPITTDRVGYEVVVRHEALPSI